MRGRVGVVFVLVFTILLTAFPAEAQDRPRYATCNQCNVHASHYNAVLFDLVAARKAFRDSFNVIEAIKADIVAARELIADEEENIRFAQNDHYWARIRHNDDGRAEADAAIKAAQDQRTDLKRLIFETLEPRLDAAARQQSKLPDAIHQLEKQLADAAAALDECERICAENGGISTITDAGFVRTICQACIGLESAINDTIGTRRNLPEQIEAATRALDDLIKQRDELRDQLAHAVEELDAAIQVGEPIETQPNPDPDALSVIEAAKQAASAEVRRLQEESNTAGNAVRTATASLEALKAYYEQLEELEAQQREALAECERKCKADAQLLADALDDSLAKTDCEPCKAVAAQLDTTLKAIRNVEAQIEDAKTQRTEAEQQVRSLAGQFRDAINAVDDAIQQGETERKAANPDAGLIAAADAAKDAATREMNRLYDALNDARNSIEPIGKAVEALQGVREGLVALAELQRQALAECEKQCQPPPPEEPIADPVPQTPTPFVTTKCPSCETIASLLNDTIGSRQSLPREQARADEALAEITEEQAELKRQFDAAKAEAEASVLEGEALRSDPATDAATMAASDARKRAAFRNMAQLERDVLFHSMDVLDPARGRIQALKDREIELKALEEKLRARLAECERTNCPPPEDPAVMPDPAPDAPSPFVTTHCPACEPIASLLNDTIGTLRNAREDLDEANAAVERAKVDYAGLERQRDEALAVSDAAIQYGEALRNEATPDADAIAAADEAKALALQRLDEFEVALHNVSDEIVFAQRRAATRQAAVTKLEELERSLRDKLAECERNCPPPVDETAAALEQEAMPDATVVFAKCPQCEEQAAALNSTLALLRAAEVKHDLAVDALWEARAALVGAERVLRFDLDQAADASTDAVNARAAGDTAGVEAATARQHDTLQDAGDLIAEIDGALEPAVRDAERALNEATAQFNDLVRAAILARAALDECEKNCGSSGRPYIPIPDFRVSLVQVEDECQRDRQCAIEATLTAGSEAEKKEGPVFISADFRTTAPDGFTCGPAAKGGTMCYGLPAGSLTLVMLATGETRVCVAVLPPSIENMDQFIQLGLLGAGFSPGTIDGKIGPKTYTAMQSYLEEVSDENAPPGLSNVELQALLDSITSENRREVHAKIFERLFGYQPADLDEYEDMLDCIDVRLAPKPVAAPKPSGAPRPPRADGSTTEVEIDDDDPPRPGVNIQMNFDRPEQHHEGQEYEDNGPGIPGFEPLGGIGFSF